MLTNEITEIGMLAFLHLFESTPDAQGSFKEFHSMTKDELKHSEIFRNHASRVTGVIKKV